MNLTSNEIMPPSTLCTLLPKTPICQVRRNLSLPQLGLGRRTREKTMTMTKTMMTMTITMRDRSKNRKPLQRGRNLSIEAIQTVQSLKRALNNNNKKKKSDNHTHDEDDDDDGDLLEQVFDSKVRRLLKFDLVAVLRELIRQNECLLALKVFEDIRKEHWYKPQVSLYADMITVLESNGLFEEVKLLFKQMKTESNLDHNTESFNRLLSGLMAKFTGTTLECFYLMKSIGCEPDKSSYRILINGLESKGEIGLSSIIREEAQKYYGESLEFLENEEDVNERKIISSGRTL